MQMTLRTILRPLSQLEHLHLGIFLSSEDLLYSHFHHIREICDEAGGDSKPFGPEWCMLCFEQHAQSVRLAELQATLALAQTLRKLTTVTWASFFGRQLQEMNNRQTTIWVFRKNGAIRVRRRPWNSPAPSK